MKPKRIQRKRGLDRRFLAKMREKMDSGRRRGYVGWDQHWEDCLFPIEPCGTNGFMFQRFMQEVVELTNAVTSGDPARIISEAADVANFAMMIADIEDALETKGGER